MYKLFTILGLGLMLSACSAHITFDTGIGVGVAQDEAKKGVALDVFGNFDGNIVSNSQDY